MTEFVKKITVNASQQEVWDVMSNLGDIYKFNPGVIKSYYNTSTRKGIGAGRVCELRPAGKVEEVATEWDEGNGFLLQVIPVEKAPPLKNIYARLVLDRQSANITRVLVTMSYETKLGVIGSLLNAFMIKGQMEMAMEGLLQGLKLNVEKGLEVEGPYELKMLLKAA